jgi:hypothetical protein
MHFKPQELFKRFFQYTESIFNYRPTFSMLSIVKEFKDRMLSIFFERCHYPID